MLEDVINFMYGIDLSGLYSTPAVESLLTMADLYLMEDLKDAVASHMAAHLDKDNIMDIYHLAEKYTAGKLKEICKDFIVSCISIAKEVLGVDAAVISKKEASKVFKKDMIVRCKTFSKWWFDSRTKISTVRPVNGEELKAVDGGNLVEVACEAGTVGRIVDDAHGKISVKWNAVENFDDFDYYGNQRHCAKNANISHLEILTPPITI